jgi:5-methylcytosine-specific restriction endonuclease McrA
VSWRQPQAPNKGILFHTMVVAQEGKCFYCGGDMYVGRHNRFVPKNAATWEHLWPRYSHPHLNQCRNNLVLAHSSCNRARDRRPLTDDEWERARQIHKRRDEFYKRYGRGVDRRDYTEFTFLLAQEFFDITPEPIF